MKTLIKSLCAALLAELSRVILWKYRPAIVMITGSVGKTSTKDAVAAALGESFYLRKSEKSYNSEFGVPLTIIGAKNPWESPSAWFSVIGEALLLILLPNHYPKVLVLEVGADRPGDLAKILRIATPDMVVVTRLPDVPVHVEAYASTAAVREEEFAPAYALRAGAPLIYSNDNAYASGMAERLSVDVTTYGSRADADVSIGTPEVMMKEGRPVGMQAPITVQGKEYHITVQGALGRPQVYAPAAALAAAHAFNVKTKDALYGLESYEPPPGRLRILEGRAGSLLIDDTYNSSPAAAEEALAALASVIGVKRRIAVLGDMLELGRYSASEHERIGKLAAAQADMVVGVGSRAHVLAEAAAKAGVSEGNALFFGDSVAAAQALIGLVREGDAILIKGSQSIRMERVTEALLANPEDARLLVRQEKEWKRR